MENIITFCTSPTAQALAWTLIHTLWQSALVGVLLLLCLKQLKAERAQQRYLVSLGALGIIVLAGLLTFSVMTYEAPERDSTAGNVPATGVASPVSGVPANPVDEAAAPLPVSSEAAPLSASNGTQQDWLVGVFIVWLAGVFILMLRFAFQLAGIARIRKSSRPVEDPVLLDMFRALLGKLAIQRPIQLLVSGTVKSPCVMGIVRPALLLPLSMLTETSAQTWEVVLAHELMHIRRFDYLVNLVQMLVETLLFFNPVVWWINRQIRVEREACCDLDGARVVGEPMAYAETLYAWFQQAARKRSGHPAALPAFSDRSDGRLLDRITRLVKPAHRPIMRISWIKLSLILLVSAVVFVGLWKTADLTVAVADKILSPQERINRIADIEKSHGRPAYDPQASRRLNDADKVTVSGKVVSADGSPLPSRVLMRFHYRRPGVGGSASVDIAPALPGASSASFSHRFSYGVIHLSVDAKGFAPFMLGPFQMKPGAVKHDILMAVDKGFPLSIAVKDAATGEGVPNAELYGGYQFRPDGYAHTIKLTTDENGAARIKHTQHGYKLTLRLTARGYETTQFKNVAIPKEGPLALTVAKAVPIHGKVVSLFSGKPVAGAEIRVQKCAGPDANSYGRDEGPLLATSDAQGRFVINTLRKACIYVLAAKAKDTSYVFVPNVTAGMDNLSIALPDRIVIMGAVKGPLDKLPLRNGRRMISYTCSFTENDHSYTDQSRYVPVKTTDQGHTFEISDIWGNHINIGRGSYRLSLPLDPKNLPEKPVAIVDLNEPTVDDGKRYHRRALEITFQTPAGSPPPKGTIRLNYKDPNYSKTTSKGQLLTIENGMVKTDIVAPGKYSIDLADTVGYWFRAQHAPVDGGTEPIKVTIPAYPAGVIYGEVLEADGGPVGNTLVSISTIKKSPLLGKEHFLGVDGKNSASSAEQETKFSIGPLPLEGVYRLIAHRGSSYAVSDAITLTEKSPIEKVTLRFAEGIAVTGQVLKPDKTPAAGMEYQLVFAAEGGGTFSCGNQFTDAEGRFRIDRVDPGAKGAYSFSVKPKKDWRPAEMPLTDLTRPIACTLEEGAALTGHVLDDKTGWPIPGAKVRAWYFRYDKEKTENENLYAEVKTDENGFFRISTLKSGREYQLFVSDCQVPDACYATGGQSEAARIRVKPYDWSKLKPRRPVKP